MSDIYLYKNKMWKVKHRFQYTGAPESFHLNSGKYLCICRGAHGGTGRLGETNHGGTSYGVLNLTSGLDAYAVVGGNGGPSVGEYDAFGVGGYNGGGRGGRPFPGTNYNCGAGGGGASDIRLSVDPDVPSYTPRTMPDYFSELTYIQSDASQYINTGFNPTPDTKVECVCELIPNSSYNSWEAVFGTRDGIGSHQLLFFDKFAGNNTFAFGCGDGGEIEDSNSVYNQVIKIVAEGDTATWYDTNDTELGSITSGTMLNCSRQLLIFDLNNGGSPDNSRSVVKLHSFKIWNDGELVRFLVPFKNTGMTLDTSELEFEQGTIDADTGLDNDSYTAGDQLRCIGYVDWDPALTYINILAKIRGNYCNVFTLFYDSSKRFIQHNNWNMSDPSHRFTVPEGTRYIRMNIGWGDGTVKQPEDLTFFEIDGWASLVTNGLYDLVNETMYTKSDGNDFTEGSITTKTIYQVPTYIKKSLLSRIIVAGGGGGGQQLDGNDYSNICGFGGGYNGGYIDTNPECSHYGDYASQSAGGEFGKGQPGPDREGWGSQYGAGEGISGGGGGWFGGYASQEGDASIHAWSSCNGGGGSGYVLTATSWKPEDYMYGLTPRNDLEFSDILMTSGTSDGAEVIICEEVNSYTTGDRLICDCIGAKTSFPLVRGSFTVECFGGAGSHRKKQSYIPCGGYAKGTFSNPTKQTAYAVVGGPSTYAGSFKGATYQQTTHPTMSFNGGGQPASLSSIQNSSEAAGGATDLRIGSDSLYARIIVAGGAGGCGSYDHYGGVGGGTSGGEYQNGGWGDNYGPGTQSAAGAGAVAEVSGGFGYGGNGKSDNGGYGGAGGGGWFGGSGTSPDGSDDDKGGSGGSGYVLTESSWKPSGYLLDEEYYMTDTSLIAGGNSKKHYTGMIIECNSVENMFMLCHDSEGYKYFNDVTGRWTFLQSATPDADVFAEYGTSTFTTDAGLTSTYTVCVYDPTETVNTMIFSVYPPSQSVKFRYKTPHIMTRYNIDCDVDESAIDFNVSTQRRGMAEDAYIYFTFTYNFNTVPNMLARVYCIQGFTQGTTSSTSHAEKKEKTIEHLNLLPVGSGNRLPSRYKNYIGSFINGNEAIESIESAVCCEHNRCIYSATLCNNKVVRFAKLNLITNTSYVIKDIPKTELGNTYYGDIKVDDNFIYLSPATNNASRTIWKTPNSSSLTVNEYNLTNSDDFNINAGGKMSWLDSHTLIMLYRRGFALFNTLTNSFVYKQAPSQNEARRDMAIGSIYALSLYNEESRSAYVCELETNTWYGLTEQFDVQWSGSYKNSICYHDGKFYVVQRGTLHILDEETMTVTDRIPTPFTTYDPKQIEYADGILYITIQGAPTLFMYNIATRTFSTAGIPFAVDNFSAEGWIRMCAFKGYGFIPNIRLYTVNYSAGAKYNLGYKYDQFMIITNAANAADPDNQYEYDERFVTFSEDNMTIHEGEITCPLILFASSFIVICGFTLSW